MTCVNKEQERKARLSSLQELYYEVKRFWTSPLFDEITNACNSQQEQDSEVRILSRILLVVRVKRFWTSPLPRNFQKIA